MMAAIWNKRPGIAARWRLWWQFLWVRKNEFHSTLNVNADLADKMCECERRRYSQEIARCRHIAHVLDLEREGEGE